MFCPTNSNFAEAEFSSRLVHNDLWAQLAPLDRYGLPRLSAAIAAGVRSLMAVFRAAFYAAVTRRKAN